MNAEEREAIRARVEVVARPTDIDFGPTEEQFDALWTLARTDVPALLDALEAAEAKIAAALEVTQSSSIPLGVSVAMHYDRLMREVRRALTTTGKEQS